MKTRHILARTIVLVMSVAAGALLYRIVLADKPSPESAPGSEQECHVAQMLRGNDLPSRLKTADCVAGTPSGAALIVEMIHDIWALDDPRDPLPSELRELAEGSEIGVLVRLIEGASSEAPVGLLIALTHVLDDRRRGVQSSKDGAGPFATVRGDGTTREVRDAAHDALVRALRVEHGLDGQEWRRAIWEGAKR